MNLLYVGKMKCPIRQIKSVQDTSDSIRFVAHRDAAPDVNK